LHRPLTGINVVLLSIFRICRWNFDICCFNIVAFTIRRNWRQFCLYSMAQKSCTFFNMPYIWNHSKKLSYHRLIVWCAMAVEMSYKCSLNCIWSILQYANIRSNTNWYLIGHMILPNNGWRTWRSGESIFIVLSTLELRTAERTKQNNSVVYCQRVFLTSFLWYNF